MPAGRQLQTKYKDAYEKLGSLYCAGRAAETDGGMAERMCEL